jgi:uncharacterized protein (DUF1800 family)
MCVKKIFSVFISFIAFFLVVSYSYQIKKNTEESELVFPYKSQGLTERQAAAHLISRFTYGATHGMIDEVVNIGLEKWFLTQLDGSIPDPNVEKKLSGYEYLKLTNAEAVNQFPKPLDMLKRAADEGLIPRDSIRFYDKEQIKVRLADFIAANKIQPQSILIKEFINQRIVKAVYSKNPLHEVLTGFWFNHFNVSLSKPQVILYAPAYERDVIRPNVTGKFYDLLIATAKSPAMQVYLDNYLSAGDKDSNNLNKLILPDGKSSQLLKKISNLNRSKGLNENYAREVMELHTMGVDGGYTQTDVTAAARILTGWGVSPLEVGRAAELNEVVNLIGKDKLIKNGFRFEDDFIFTMNRHDAKPKTFLHANFPADQGYEEGVRFFEMIAHHPSTANFISKKIATYFVSDNPPQSLLKKMSKTFLTKNGDVKQVLLEMVKSPDFWSRNAIRNKTKSPFDLVISTLRILDADLVAPRQVFLTLEKLGQKIYFYQAPTGFPDRADYWINTGALLNRMNFGIEIASNQQKGVRVDLLKLNNYHEPESSAAALATYANLLLPERDMKATIKRLTPFITDVEYQKRLLNSMQQIKSVETLDKSDMMDDDTQDKKMSLKVENDMLAQVIGIILGSPEFQRR